MKKNQDIQLEDPLEGLRLHWSKICFHKALDLILKLDKVAVRCEYSNNALDTLAFLSRKLTIGDWSKASSCDGSDMVIKDLDLERMINAVMREFLE
ncbi:hypothetical protein Tco_0668134 [Tanacetum coccineum]